MTTARDAIELAKSLLAGGISSALHADTAEKFARALLAEHERAERLEAGLREALALYDEKCVGCNLVTSCDCPSGYHTDDCRSRRITELRKLLQEKP